MIQVKCFGVAKEIVDNSEVAIDYNDITVAELRNVLNTTYPSFTQIKGYMVAVNQEYALDDHVINQSDEVAIIPPVSGG